LCLQTGETPEELTGAVEIGAVEESGCLRVDLAGAARAVAAHPLLTATTTSVVTFAVTIDVDEVVAGTVADAVGAVATHTEGAAEVVDAVTV
jgi:hypothetical protein